MSDKHTKIHTFFIATAGLIGRISYHAGTNNHRTLTWAFNKLFLIMTPTLFPKKRFWLPSLEGGHFVCISSRPAI